MLSAQGANLINGRSLQCSLRGKTQNHSADSLETLVEKIVKTWECQVGLQRDWIGFIQSLLHIFVF